MLPGAQVTVPRRRLRIEALQGLETEVARQDVDLTARDAASVALRLRRLYDARSRGWTSGNTHLHLRGLSRDEAIRYLQTVSRADGLDLVFLSYLRSPATSRRRWTCR